MTAGSDIQYVVMGVTGSGKTTVATGLAKSLGRRLVDGDSLHPASNVAKMAAGDPLTDADRWPWLARICDVLSGDEPVVVACSALRRSYRDLLRSVGGVVFVFLDLDLATATERTARRASHFMRAEMVAGQFAVLERPGPDEDDVVIVDATREPVEVLTAAVAAASSATPGTD